ncbi:MAG: LysR family transcriptional regulator [Candidatus Thiodiazotropha sp. (ex Ctena orbiculata)]|nr:LysR family transcriptional regulator [Candidatus Thiodiazotropha taylori]PUB87640.1 MAG: LysR family transcriptional regulator [gamma proteobacterium symbiont of Ctena orbiculata]MBT2996310.1 LysR family transcriptional regulator [Candidatus Thiodiazotropha taylori]MBT3000256.1 LysR family transcriptional regulator [Candidatus Thiodiazotropha taylori]MBT3028146.1 LysR family transcriptional regulator [Candidatus Thiodiazotropha taylori]
MIELTHLKIIAALEQQGTLTAAAEALCLSQSALSHQIRYLEKKLGVAVWEKQGRRLRLTLAGAQLLKSAQEILPMLEQCERRLEAIAAGRQGVLRIGVECYPCYEWLTGVIADFLRGEAEVDVDIFHRFQFSGLEGLLNRHIDLLITPDKMEHPVIRFETLFEYELVLLVSKSHALADQQWVEPNQLARENLITFPVTPERLDILTLFLWPAAVRSLKLKQIESFEIMLQLVSYNRGICALPDWLAAKVCSEMPLKTVRLGSAGLTRELYATYRREDREIGYLQRFLQRAVGFAPK